MPNSIRTTANTQTTPPAHQAFSGSPDDGLSVLKTSQRKVIDLTTADDDEVILISSHDLSHIAFDIQGAINVLDDIGQLLALIHYEKIDVHTAKALARLTHDATCTWSNLLHDQLESINKSLAQTRYGKEAA